MGDEDLTGMQMIDPEQDANAQSDAAQGSAAQGDTAGGPDLSGLLGALMGGGAGMPSGQPAAGGGADLSGLLGALLGGGAGMPSGQGATAGGGDLSGLLGALLGGGAGMSSGQASAGGLAGLLGGLLGGGGLDVNGVAQQSGVSHSLIQAALPLVIGALLGGRQGRSAGVDIESPGAASGDLAGLLQSGEPVSDHALRATGLPEELARQTGANHDEATAAIQGILAALGGGTGA